MSYVSTGKAAELLSVTPDAVLKWIKKGKLRVRKTAGGHYRVSLDSINKLLASEEESFSETSSSVPIKQRVPCWEFHAVDGKIKDDCRTCLIFKSRGEKCYEVGMALKKERSGATCCPTSCEDCEYFKTQKLQPVNVLVFTESDSLRDSLKKEAATSNLRLQFASCEYDCSLVVDSFRPEYAVLDCSKEITECEELCEHLRNDPRIPGVKIMIGLPPEKKGNIRGDSDIAVIQQPFHIAELEGYIADSDFFRQPPK
jgi:excisionase family DNA binding protein